MSNIDFLKGFFKKTVTTTQDIKIPHNFQLGSVVKVSPVVFALKPQESLVQPINTEVNVSAISSLKNKHGERTSFRAYVEQEDDKDAFFQVTNNPNSPIVWFTHLYRFYPQTQEDMDAFMGLGYGNGDKEFPFNKSMLMDANVPEHKIELLLGNEEQLVFTRMWGDSDYLEPILEYETKKTDISSEKGIAQECRTMLYCRQLSDDSIEYLLISLEAEESKDGKVSNEVHVDFMIGCDIDVNRISIF